MVRLASSESLRQLAAVAERVRLITSATLWLRLVLPERIDHWSLTSLQQRLVKTGGRLVKHARYYWRCWRRVI